MSESTDAISSGECETFLTNAFGDQYLYSVNRHLFNTNGADAVYRDYLPNFIWAENSLFILIGTDSGLLIEHIAKHGVPSGSRYLFVELEGILEQVSKNLASLELEPGITLCNQADWVSKAEEMGSNNYLYMNQVYVIKSLGAMHAYLPSYLELANAVTAETTAWEWFLRQQYSSTQLIECQLANAAEDQTPVSTLKGSFQGKTAVLLASGPSLDEMLPWVRANRDKLLVTAISRSSRRLTEAGLTPDMVFTIDPNDVSYTVSKEMLNFNPDVMLVNAHQALPRLVAQWRGPKAYMGSCLPWNEESENPYLGLTVTNAAIEALMIMGCSQIVLAGVDLCFSADGAIYSSGTSESDAGPVLGHIGPKVETNAGQMAETFDGYTQAINNLAEQGQRADEMGCRLINPAPGAAKITNVEHLPIEAILVEPLVETPICTFRRVLPPDDSQHRLAHYQKLDGELRRFSARLEKVTTIFGDILQSINGLFGRNGIQHNTRCKARIIECEERLENEFADELKLIKQYTIREFLRFYGRSEIGERRLEEAKTDGRSYYEACRDGARKLIAMLQKARERVASRIAEEEPSTAFSTLCSQWNEDKDNTPGRALVWQQYHPEQYSRLTPNEQALYTNEISKFNEQISSNPQTYVHQCQQRTRLTHVHRKVKLLFHKRDITGLKNLIRGLTKYHGDEDQAQSLIHFSIACLAELENNYNEAIEHFRLVTMGSLVEDALRHVGYLSIRKGDATNALNALECLSNISITYVPVYAELAWNAGYVKEAMELFTRYLQEMPTDLKTYLQLGKLYLKQGIAEAAHLAFTHVLEQDPQNKTAKNLLEALNQSQEERRHKGT